MCCATPKHVQHLLDACRLYLGMEKRNGEVIVEEGHKWSNTEYFRLTGLKEYAPYMLGGG